MAQGSPAVVEVRDAAQVPRDIVLDPLEPGAPQWRLSHHVAVGGATPTEPRPVYVQFGYMGCQPCHALAAQAGASLPANVLRVYVHLDDVELEHTPRSLPELWQAAHTFVSTRSEYEGFVGLRRGSLAMLTQWFGSEAVPSSLLIAPDGTYRALTTPSREEAAEAFATFASD